MIGKTILHYKILEKLGGGGMGVVYKAEDLKLKRIVALKFLPPELTRDDEAKHRFIHEAQAASALEHPNICTIFEIDETDEGQSFIAMSYCEGETLKDKIERGPFPFDQTMDIAIQCCKGLTKAHEKGIIHRDIKPANMMITDEGEVKIVDFGLAKLSGRTQLTRERSTLGTVAYMSPEQARGEEINHRTDIWSLGAVLYEMISGQLPFKGEYEQAVVHSIVNEEPIPLTGLRTAVPVELERIIFKCLEKNPSNRYQHMDELMVDLRHLKRELDEKKIPIEKISKKTIKEEWHKKIFWPGIILLFLVFFVIGYLLLVQEVESKERIPIAVVDFVNDTDEEELNGLSGMLITALEQSHRLNVLTRSRMFDILEQLEMADTDRIDELLCKGICNQADIRMLAMATIRKFGKIYTIDFKVLDVKNDEYLFTTKEQGEGQESIPLLIDNLSEKTRKGLKEKLTEIKASSQKISEVTTPNLEAYQHYFRGEELINKLKFEEAQEEFQKAISLDTTFGLAYYRLAYAIDWESNAASAKSYIQQAIKLIYHIPEKERYLVQAVNAHIEKGFEAGLIILKEMEQKYPHDKEMVYNIGDWSWHVGDYAVAVKYLEEVLAMDPKLERALQHLTWAYRDIGQFEKMLEIAKRYVSVAASSESYELLAEAFIFLEDFETALKTIKQAQELHPDYHNLTSTIANIYIQQEKYNEAEAELMKLIEKDKSNDVKQRGYQNLTQFYPYVGRYREAIEYIDKRIKFRLQIEDTAGAAYLHLSKGIFLFEARNDINLAMKEVEKSFQFKRRIKDEWYWTGSGLPLLYVFHNDFMLAESLAQLTPKWWESTILTLIQTEKNECTIAESLTDSVLQGAPGFCKILVLFHLAECYYDKKQYDKAEECVLNLQTVRDYHFGIRAIYYPKSFYLLARIYEEKGDLRFSIKNYHRFLDLWKDADQNLPELIDAKNRLAETEKITVK